MKSVNQLLLGRAQSLRGLLLFGLIMITSISAKPLTAFGSPADTGPQMLPSGFLSVRGSQIIGDRGGPVRLACIGGFGTVTVGGRLDFPPPYKGIDTNVAELKKRGFNCIRVDFNNKNLDDAALMTQFDHLVAVCGKYGVKVIFDNHNNEATPANWGNAAQQSNGLWFDTGPGTDGTDGAGDKGTISNAKFLEDWVRMAKRWAGNPTVIGFDIRNEPCAHTSTPALWGGGGPTDIHVMYESVGNAILAVNPNALIICESVINYKTDSYEGDLSIVKMLPIVLNKPAKLVYSVHEYPREIGGYKGPESGVGYIERMNRTWGWLIKQNVAPVWIGEMGSSMKTAEERAWGETLLSYMNGSAANGLSFSRNQQPVSGDWWCWGNRSGELPDGCLNEDGRMRPEQAPFIERMLFQQGQAAAVSPPALSVTADPGTSQWRQFSVNGMGVNLLLPEGYSATRKYPLVLYLHQLDMGNWPEGLLKEINPWFNATEWRKAYPAIVISPLLDQKADPSGKTINFGGVSPEDQTGEDNAVAAVQQVIKQYSVDPSRVYVTGNSLGGIGTWDLLIKYNAISGTSGKIFAAGMPLAGATYDHGYPTPDPSVVSALMNVPIWAIHGAGDTQVPLVWDKALAAALSGQSTFHLTLDSHLSHDVWDTYYVLPTGKACWDWLFAQKAPEK